MATTRRENEMFAENLLVDDPLDKAIEWIHHNLKPEDVFTQTQLSQWAEENGYIEE
jgi:hypothetical protein